MMLLRRVLLLAAIEKGGHVAGLVAARFQHELERVFRAEHFIAIQQLQILSGHRLQPRI